MEPAQFEAMMTVLKSVVKELDFIGWVLLASLFVQCAS